jgi:hypothetical protein
MLDVIKTDLEDGARPSRGIDSAAPSDHALSSLSVQATSHLPYLFVSTLYRDPLQQRSSGGTMSGHYNLKGKRMGWLSVQDVADQFLK